MNAELKVSVNGADMPVPEGVDLLGEVDLYSANFSLLQLSEVEDVEATYKWSNPRRLGAKDGAEGAGLAKADMDELYADIRDEGLMNPLICRWIARDGVLTIQVLDGERRWRCIDKMTTKDEKCWDRGTKRWLPATQVYKTVPCRIITGNDKDALKIAFMVSDRSINWGEAATAKLIRRLRDCQCDDEEILDLTKKSSQWLREQDRICALDDLSFNYLTDGKINRALALKLADIDDVDRRHRHLHAAYDDAVANHKEVVAKAEEDLIKAVEKEQYAEAELDEAMVKGEDTTDAEGKLQDAQEKTQQKRQARSAASRPKAKTANLRRAASKLAEEEGEAEVGDDVRTPLRPGKIEKQLQAIQAIIANGGKDEENKDVLDVASLRACEVCYKAIINGEEDVIRLLRRFRAANIIQQKRKEQKALQQEVELDDDHGEDASEE